MKNIHFNADANVLPCTPKLLADPVQSKARDVISLMMQYIFFWLIQSSIELLSDYVDNPFPSVIYCTVKPRTTFTTVKQAQ
jgi:hypothetical protein